MAAGISALGPELDDVVGGSDDVGVVLDDDDGVARSFSMSSKWRPVVGSSKMKRMGLSAWRERLAVPEPDGDGP